ncbi:MAG: hypothetical protein H6835_12110 [Planctomycetes bacterium]|nr:hypothetical protein [Planctomycetota bacterium]
MSKRLFLIDGTALAYRSFFAFQGTGRAPLTTKDGHPTAATYGFCTTLRALLEREQPDAVAIAFDGPRADLLRTKIYPEYKSTRTKMPDEMAVQLDDIREAARGFGLPIVESETHEADDVIGTLAVQGRDAGMEVFVVTGDKDFLQIVDEHIKLWNLRSSTSKPEIFDAAACEAKWGVGPTAMVDLLALMGDSSDNVPGVPKVGQKTAVELLQQFGSLDGIYQHLDEVKKPSIQQSLRDNRDKALLSQQLVTLQLDLPLGVELDAIGPATPDPDKLRPLFQRLEFKNLLADLAAKATPQEQVEQHYTTVASPAELDALLRRLGATERFAVAAETTGKRVQDKALVGVAFAEAPGRASYVPLDGTAGARAAVLESSARCSPRRRRRRTCTTQAPDDRAAERRLTLAGVGTDTMLASYCAEPGLRSHALGDLALQHFAYKKTSEKDVLGSGRKQRTFAELDPALVGDYVCEEADLVLRLGVPLRRRCSATAPRRSTANWSCRWCRCCSTWSAAASRSTCPTCSGCPPTCRPASTRCRPASTNAPARSSTSARRSSSARCCSRTSRCTASPTCPSPSARRRASTRPITTCSRSSPNTTRCRRWCSSGAS